MTQEMSLYDRRRQEILQAAVACFGEKGFRATTMADIARRLGMSAGNLYNYFRGKDVIVEELAHREIERVLAEVTRATDVSEADSLHFDRIRQVALARMESVNSRISLEILAESAHNERIRDIVYRYDMRWRSAIEACYTKFGLSASEASIRADLDLALINGLAQRVQANPNLDRQAMASAVSRAIIKGLT